MQIFLRILRTIGTGLKIIAKAALLLPLLAGMIWFNYTVDRSGLFQGERYEREMAEALMAGNNLTGNEKMNERLLHSMYAQFAEQAPGTIALGSSRILQLNAEIAGTDDFFNCGMVGGDFQDLLGTFYLFDRAEKLPQNIIIGLDPWLLNADAEALDYRSDRELYNEFLSVGFGIETDYEEPDKAELWQALVSPSYFQGNVAYYFRDSSLEKKPEIVTGDLYSQKTDVKMYDGSILYNQPFREGDQEKVEQRARDQAATFQRMNNYVEPDPELAALFDRFIQYATGKGVNVVFVMVPYNPIVYDYVTEKAGDFPGFFAVAEWYESYALANNIPLYGSYNPYVAGCWETDFYDGYHIRGEALRRVFPGMPTVEKQQRAGTAGSPWLFSQEPRVPYQTAEKIVVRINEIAQPEWLERGEDIDINGVSCHLLLRYRPGEGTGSEEEEPKPVLLASYAVSHNEGVFYRLDTNINDWVIDPRF